MSQIKNYEAYCNKVFNLSQWLKSLEDQRQEPAISIESIVTAFFYGASLQIKAVSQMEEETKIGVLKRFVQKTISDDTFRYGLDNLKTDSLNSVWGLLCRKYKNLGTLRQTSFNDYIVGIVDCIEVYSSQKRECKRCLTRVVETKKGTEKQFYHRMVVLAVVGKDYCIPIGLEMLNIGEGEVDCALRLLKRVIKTLGKRYLDIVIADAMYCTPHFFQECERLGVIPGAVLKANQENLLKTAERQREQNAPTGTVTDKKDEVKTKVWDMPDVSWDTADKDVRVIWAELETSRPSGDKKEKKDAPGNSEEAKKRVFVFSDKLNHLPYRIMYEIGVHRWDIDAGLFMDLTKHCYLKHKSLHFSRAYENMLILRMIAYFLFMHYHYKHIDSRRKDKIKNPTSMARALYRSACQCLKPFY